MYQNLSLPRRGEVGSAGFPILDRYGHASLPIVGYRGAFQLATKIADTLMEEFDRNCADEDMDLIM